MRDEYRTDYDVGRGGYGKLVQNGLAQKTQGGGAARPEAPAGGWAGQAMAPQGIKRGREMEEVTPRADSKRPRDERSNPRFRGERGDEEDE